MVILLFLRAFFDDFELFWAVGVRVEVWGGYLGVSEWWLT